MDDHIATTYGIARKSILRYYHVVDGLPPDCMHDVLEGVLPYKTKMLLLKFITERHYFGLSDLNGRIHSFPLGDTESSRPSPISSATLCSSDKKLKQSGIFCKLGSQKRYLLYVSSIASEMWCLGRYLPLLIGDLIPDDDEHWENSFAFWR